MDAHARMLDPESHVPAKAASDLGSPGAPASAAELDWQGSPGFYRDEMPALDVEEDAPGVSPQQNGVVATVPAEVQPSAATEVADTDAEQVIEGVRTRWTLVCMPGSAADCSVVDGAFYSQRWPSGEQGEDREILHAALKGRGNLTAAACCGIMARARDAAESWPLPRTERLIRARLEWLAAKLVLQTKGSTQ
jgi:hypothetical protein